MMIRPLDETECTTLLAEHRVGYLACANNGQPYVVPIFFAYADKSLYAFSMPGKKVDWMRASPMVSVLVDARGEGREWRNVVVDGRYEEIPDRIGQKRDRDHAWSLLSRHHVDWWEPGGLKPVTPPLSNHSPHLFFRIAIERVSGREAKE